MSDKEEKIPEPADVEKAIASEEDPHKYTTYVRPKDPKVLPPAKVVSSVYRWDFPLVSWSLTLLYLSNTTSIRQYKVCHFHLSIRSLVFVLYESHCADSYGS